MNPTERHLERVMNRHDPDHDIGPTAPVPWYVTELIAAIRKQEEAIEALRDQIDIFDQQLNGGE